MKYLMFTFLAIVMIGSFAPIAQVSARGNSDDNYRTSSHDRYDDDDENEDYDEDEDNEDDENDDDSFVKQNTTTTPVINTNNEARIKILQELLTKLIALLNQLENGSTVNIPITPVASSTAQAYTKAMVATHNTKASCWSIINSNVYDLTDYVSRHPGGSQSIAGICGKDGTSAFTGQHGGSSKPEAILSGFYLAPLAR
jgi:cytochrome b involved in lipid metabolism